MALFVHPNDYASVGIELPQIADWFTLTSADLDLIATRLLHGADSPCKVRTGMEIVPLGKIIVGAPPVSFESELAIATREARALAVKTEPQWIILAVSYYHLKFEAIHPFTDGNGRIGRYIMAQQICSRFKISAKEILDGILEGKKFYQSVFLPGPTDNQRIEILADILYALTGVLPLQLANSKVFDFTPAGTTRAENGQFRFFAAQKQRECS